MYGRYGSPRADTDTDDFFGAAPNCVNDLVPMKAVTRGQAVVWCCPLCGLVSVI